MAHDTEVVLLELLDSGACLDAANRELRRICADVVARPLVDKPRTVTIEIEVSPEVDKETNTNYPVVSWKTGCKMPGTRGRSLIGFVEDGDVRLNLGDPGNRNPMQTTLDNVTELGSARKG